MSDPVESIGRSSTPHHFLAQLAGAWTGSSLTWMDPNEAPHQSPVQGSIQLILEGRFALYLYQYVLMGEPHHGLFTFGFNTVSNRYEASWVDSFHNNTAIMFCSGEAREHGFAVLGSYPDPSGGPPWGWRTEVFHGGRDELIVTAYNIDPEAVETKAVETRLARGKSAGRGSMAAL
jgi:hypothetical protein